MATIEANIQSALMERVQSLAGFQILWPGVPTSIPEGEHVRVTHQPNANSRFAITSRTAVERMGFLYLAHYFPVGDHEVVAKNRAGLIAEHFPRDLKMRYDGVIMRVNKVDVGRGVEDDGFWRTLVSVDYRGFA